MVSSAWFFSTLAQATAAIIGLTLAFTISTHLSRRERQKARTDELREELADLREKYQYVLDTMSRALRDSDAQFNTPDIRFDLTGEQNDVEQWAAQQPDSETARAWAYISGAAAILSNIDVLSEYTLDRKQFSQLNGAATELKNLFRRSGGIDETLYQQITQTDTGSVPSDYYFEDILEENNRVESWWSRYSTTYHDNIAGVRPNDPAFTGKNLFSWAMLFEDMERDGIEIGSHAVGTEVTSDFMSPRFVERVIWTSMKLGFVGVLLPSLFLISSPGATLPVVVVSMIPPWVTGWGTILVQGGLLVVTGFYSLVLFLIMLLDVHYELPTMASALGDGEDLQKEPTGLAERGIAWVLAFALDLEKDTDERTPQERGETDANESN